MLSLVQTWFTAGANPVGIDFGTERLRLAQVEKTGADHRLVAAASADIPPEVRNIPAARSEFLSAKLRELWIGGNFRGRRAVMALPAAVMHVQHLRLPRMDGPTLTKAIPWEVRGKMPLDPATAMLRHLVAGEIYHEQQPRVEVIVMAAPKGAVDTLLAAANSARLDVVGISVESRALLDCFLHIYRRKSDADVTNCFIDIGSGTTRVMVARGGHILFIRNLPIGGDLFNRAAAAEFSISVAEARALRMRLATQKDDEMRELPTPSEIQADGAVTPGGLATLAAPPATRASRHAVDRRRMERAIHAPASRLTEELTLCRRYHEATFPRQPIERLIFVGGEAHQRGLCQQIARSLGIVAQLGDPMVRLARTTDVGVESGIDRRLPQPDWAVAIGLTLGAMPQEAK